VLGADLTGACVHGSLALGDYDSARSDVDLLAVCAAPLALADRAAIATGLAAAALPCPAAGGLEFSLITRAAAHDPDPAPAYELHGWDAEGRLRPDPGPGDPDLPLHYAVARACGIGVAGPPPAALFRAVDRRELLPRLAAEIDWAEAHASPAYRVLGACRASRLLDDDVICSKRAAAEWVLAQGPGPVVSAALAHHLAATASDDLDAAAVARFTAAVRSRLAAACK
jgi:streptomycin 3"-adenylyltransferase